MGFLDKAKAAAETAAAKAKDAAEDVQQKRDLSSTYNELGKVTFDLIESGEVSNPQLDELAEKIRGLKEKIAGGDGVLVGASAGSSSEEYDDSQPPAMPS
jgi:cob(I)alamin adenosyltransferase